MKLKAGQIWTNLSTDHHPRNYIHIIAASDTHIKYYYIDDLTDVINRPIHTWNWDRWYYVQG